MIQVKRMCEALFSTYRPSREKFRVMNVVRHAAFDIDQRPPCRSMHAREAFFTHKPSDMLSGMSWSLSTYQAVIDRRFVDP